jgi:hypothetical protein
VPDYTGNSNKDKETGATPPGKVKNVEKVIVNDVIVKKPGIGRKFRDLFIEADFRTVAGMVAFDVLLPAAKNMILEAMNRGSEQMLFGKSHARRSRFGVGPRSITTYQTPVQRSMGYEHPLRTAPPMSHEPRTVTSRVSRNDIILTTRKEAEDVLEGLRDIIEQYEIASLADLYGLLGLSSTPVDNKWGWDNLHSADIRQIAQGYLIDFPPPVVIG